MSDSERDRLTDDSVSLNSTIQSEPQEEYPVEAILAERKYEGVKQYLVRWEGYSDLRCTWEPIESFTDKTNLLQWEARKRRIKDGEEEQYDVAALQEEVEKWIAETAARKTRRREKRLRLGLPVATEEPADLLEGPESDEYIERFDGAAHASKSGSEDDAATSSAADSDDEDRPVTRAKGRSTRGLTKPIRKGKASHTKRSTRPSKSTQPILINSETDEEDFNPSPQEKSKKASGSREQKAKHHRDAQSQPKKKKLDDTLLSGTTKSSSKQRTDTLNSEAVQENEPREPPRKSGTNNSVIAGEQASGATKPVNKQGIGNLDTVQRSGTIQSPLKEPPKGTFSQPTSLVRKINPPSKTPLSKPQPVKSLKASFLDPKGPKASNLGGMGRGPARMTKKTTESTTRGHATGAAILRRWDADPKDRKLQAASGPEKARAFSTFGKKRRFEKVRRSDPAPNPDQLTFVDLKRGTQNPLTMPDEESEPVVPKPFQLLQQFISKEKTPPPEAQEDHNLGNVDADDDGGMFMEVEVESPGTMVVDQPSDTTHQTKTEIYSSLDALLDTPSQKTTTGNGKPISRQSSGTWVSTTGDSAQQPQITAAEGTSIAIQESALSDTSMDHTDLNNDALSEDTKPVSPVTKDAGGQMADTRRRLSMKSYSAVAGVGKRVVQPALQSATAPAMFLSQLQGDRGLSKQVKPSAETLSDILGTLFVGTDNKWIGDVRYRGLSMHAKQLFMTIRNKSGMYVQCTQICNVDDYKTYFDTGESIYYGAGHILPFPETRPAIDNLAEALKRHDSCALYYAAGFTLILYPAGAKSFDIFDKVYIDAPEEKLRFVMRTPISEQLLQVNEMSLLAKESMVKDDEFNPNAMFKRYFDIDYSKVLPSQGRYKFPSETPEDSFYLLYPPQRAEECSIVIHWLLANSGKIYTSFDNGDWDNFVLKTTNGRGVVFIHESITKLHQLPYLAHLLTKAVNLFVINLRPNIGFQLDSISTRSSFTRLFPHGAAILLTDSLFLYHPAKALRILEWFRLCILENKPRKTWKFVMRPGLRGWILSIVQERSGEEGKKYMQIFEQIYKLLPLDMLDDDDNYETPLENAPIVCPRTLDKFDFGVGLGDKKNDKDGIIRNDEFLAEWFAEWTRRHLDRHRKYHAVVGDGEGKDPRKDWGKRWTYILPMTVDVFIKAHYIAYWERDGGKEKAEARIRERVIERERRKQQSESQSPKKEMSPEKQQEASSNQPQTLYRQSSPEKKLPSEKHPSPEKQLTSERQLSPARRPLDEAEQPPPPPPESEGSMRMQLSAEGEPIPEEQSLFGDQVPPEGRSSSEKQPTLAEPLALEHRLLPSKLPSPENELSLSRVLFLEKSGSPRKESSPHKEQTRNRTLSPEKQQPPEQQISTSRQPSPEKQLPAEQQPSLERRPSLISFRIPSKESSPSKQPFPAPSKSLSRKSSLSGPSHSSRDPSPSKPQSASKTQTPIRGLSPKKRVSSEKQTSPEKRASPERRPSPEKRASPERRPSPEKQTVADQLVSFSVSENTLQGDSMVEDTPVGDVEEAPLVDVGGAMDVVVAEEDGADEMEGVVHGQNGGE